jgi:hypothetical protein
MNVFDENHRWAVENSSEERSHCAFELILSERIVELLNLIRRRDVNPRGHCDEGYPRLQVGGTRTDLSPEPS